MISPVSRRKSKLKSCFKFLGFVAIPATCFITVPMAQAGAVAVLCVFWYCVGVHDAHEDRKILFGPEG